MKGWVNIKEALPPVNKIVECLGGDRSVYDASLFDIDHSRQPIVRFLLNNIDEIRFSFPEFWREKPKD